jgi:hypothetical protein
MRAAPDAIHLKILFVERPSEDPLIANAIWKEVDQIGSLPAETKRSLTENGFRIGIISSNPPPQFQKLLGLVDQIPDDSRETGNPFMGVHRFVPSGLETEIQTAMLREQCSFDIRAAGRTRSVEYQQVQCVLRTKAHRLQEGWVRIDFVPEIHYGDKQIRHAASDQDWQLQTGQNTDVCQGQKFSLSMNVGEWVIVTSTRDDEGSLGDRFFCYTDKGHKMQRALIVRVEDSGKAEGSGR